MAGDSVEDRPPSCEPSSGGRATSRRHTPVRHGPFLIAETRAGRAPPEVVRLLIALRILRLGRYWQWCLCHVTGWAVSQVAALRADARDSQAS
jgi:hypothetical protein